MIQRNAIKLNILLVLFVLMVFGGNVLGQRSKSLSSRLQSAPLMQERRPFDFSDKFYQTNGVWPDSILDRRNGNDSLSVVDYISDPAFRNVRLIATMPAYGTGGEMLFWNPYGELTRDAFIADETGEHAMQAATRFPVFFFPSSTAPGKDRQAVLIEIGEGYQEKNPLGLGLAIMVEYTPEIRTEAGALIMAELAKRNGLSLDRTPIIRTAKEIYELTRLGMVKQRVRGSDGSYQSPFVIAKVIMDPTLGAISPDAYLNYVTDRTGTPLEAERKFLSKFECLQGGGNYCG